LEELRKTVAQVFRHTGKSSIDEKGFKLTVSMGLKWFSPNEAKDLLRTAIEAGLLKKRGNRYRPSFDPTSIDIPLDFRPSRKVLEVPEIPLFAKVVDAIIKVTGQERTAVVSKINKKHDKLNIDVRVVALLVAREAGIDIGPFFSDVEEHIIRTYGLVRPVSGGEEEEE
jgi:hypothetical protein